MNETFTKLLSRLQQCGWRVDLPARRQSLPKEIVDRYPWIPAEYRKMVEETGVVTSTDDKAWLLTVSDFSGSSDGAYAWNEWERQSLDAAGSDEKWKGKIREFWDNHLPVLMSIKAGYAYFAIEKTTLEVVYGEEPEFEETLPAASSVVELLELIASKDPRLARWI